MQGRGFKYLVDTQTLAGARATFETICLNLAQDRYGSEAHDVRVMQGDRGIDTLIGDLSKPVAIYQCKFFPECIGESQKQQIRDSFQTMIKYAPNTAEWVLCVPLVLSASELSWWFRWSAKVKEEFSGIKMTLFDGEYLIKKLKDTNRYNSIFDDDIRIQLSNIESELEKEKRRVLDEVIYNAEQIRELGVDYGSSIFIKMLESARITNIEQCTTDFFNAEIVEHSLKSKGLEDGIRAYENLKYKVFHIWQTEFRINADDDDGNSLLSKVYSRIENLDTTTLASPVEVNLMAKEGMLHQLADERKLGWISNYLVRLTEYIGA